MVHISEVKTTASSFGVYALCAGLKTLWNMARHGYNPGMPEVYEHRDENRVVSVIKSGAKIGGGLFLSAAAVSAVESAAGVAAEKTGSSAASAVHSVAGVVFDHLAFSAKILAAFTVGYLVERCRRRGHHPTTVNNLKVEVNVNVRGGEGIHVVPKVEYTKNGADVSLDFQRKAETGARFRKVVQQAIEYDKIGARDRKEAEELEMLKKAMNH